MSSNEKNEKTEKCSATQKNSDIYDKLEDLSCPFTWGMKNVIENRNKLLDADENRFEMVVDLQDIFPEFALLYHLMLAYENVMNDDLPNAMQSINNAEESLADIKQKATWEDLENVLQHIFVATKCHVLQIVGRVTEVDELLEGIYDVNDMDKLELAILHGCQCLNWMLYYATDNLQAIESARKAIEYDPDNGKWYFLLGKNYRRLRRRHNSIAQPPSSKESLAFEKAFQLSENILFGVSLAQLYRESRNYNMANIIYRRVYDLQPTCCKVRLQLALGFIRAKQCTLAKDCLDYVAEKMPNSIIYSHYMAIYQEKCNRDSKAALPYYKSTTEKSNHVAEWQYIECRKKVEPDWDPLPYMLGLLKKYEKDSNHTIQGINIQIGAYYLFEENDVLSACPYLTKAIEISPNAKLLTDHFMLHREFERVNIYHALTKEIEFALKNGATMYDDDKIAVLKDMLQLCRKNSKDSSSSYRGQTPSPQKSSNYRNYGRGRSPRAGISYAGERSSSSSRGFPRNHPQGSRDDARNSPRGFSNTYKDERDPASMDRVRGRGIRPTASTNPREKNVRDEAAASCSLVKTMKDLNL